MRISDGTKRKTKSDEEDTGCEAEVDKSETLEPGRVGIRPDGCTFGRKQSRERKPIWQPGS